jgi:opacity protein-like surface antigen
MVCVALLRGNSQLLRNNLSGAGLIGLLALLAPMAMAQEKDEAGRHEVIVQGTGFFTKDSQGNGNSQHSTDTGGFLASYRYHFNRWLAGDATYGYARNTLQNVTTTSVLNVQSNIHQATGALVVTFPVTIARLKPYALAGAGALVFDPTGNPGGFVPGAGRQTKGAFVYGGGAEVRIMRHVSLLLEYRGLVYKRPDFGLAALNSDATTHTAQPSAGIAFRF